MQIQMKEQIVLDSVETETLYEAQAILRKICVGRDCGSCPFGQYEGSTGEERACIKMRFDDVLGEIQDYNER